MPDAFPTQDVNGLVKAIMGSVTVDAMTLSRLVIQPDGCLDSRIIAATPKAAELFGLKRPDDLVGYLVSKIWYPADAQVTKLYSFARDLGGDFAESVPSTYPMRLLHFPSKEPLWVWKWVEQIVQQDSIFWLTRFEISNQHKTLRMPEVPNLDELLREHTRRRILPSDMPYTAAKEGGNSLTAKPDVDNTIKPDVGKSSENTELITLDRHNLLLQALEGLRCQGIEKIWVRQGERITKVAVHEIYELCEHAKQEGKRLCLKCLYASRAYAPNSTLCPNCDLIWFEPYKRKPYGKRKRA
ncbi:MAG: hypothetical protein OEU26_29010 [Candidatus Tectomicrobia bacterium]|nr:hypothetical protein [Candidatus Tectomicrobia bacterium]